jgi:hypothetical protein
MRNLLLAVIAISLVVIAGAQVYQTDHFRCSRGADAAIEHNSSFESRRDELVTACLTANAGINHAGR